MRHQLRELGHLFLCLISGSWVGPFWPTYYNGVMASTAVLCAPCCPDCYHLLTPPGHQTEARQHCINGTGNDTFLAYRRERSSAPNLIWAATGHRGILGKETRPFAVLTWTGFA